MLQYFTDRNLKWVLPPCLTGLGLLTYDRGDLPQTEQYLQEALSLSQRQEGNSSNAVGISRVLHRLGQMLITSGDHRHDKARQHFRNALELAIKYKMAPVALDVCVSVAQLLSETDELNRAVELATLTGYHKASTFEAKQKARQLLTGLEDQVPPAIFRAAQAKGQALDWQQTAQQLIE